jgi:GAF domain-containing protein
MPAVELLVFFANQAAIAIESARLYERSKEMAAGEERRRQELEALLGADDRMQRYLHQDQVLQAISELQFFRGGGIAARAAEIGAPVLVEDSLTDPGGTLKISAT